MGGAAATEQEERISKRRSRSSSSSSSSSSASSSSRAEAQQKEKEEEPAKKIARTSERRIQFGIHWLTKRMSASGEVVWAFSLCAASLPTASAARR